MAARRRIEHHRRCGAGDYFEVYIYSNKTSNGVYVAETPLKDKSEAMVRRLRSASRQCSYETPAVFIRNVIIKKKTA